MVNISHISYFNVYIPLFARLVNISLIWSFLCYKTYKNSLVIMLTI